MKINLLFALSLMLMLTSICMADGNLVVIDKGDVQSFSYVVSAPVVASGFAQLKGSSKAMAKWMLGTDADQKGAYCRSIIHQDFNSLDNPGCWYKQKIQTTLKINSYSLEKLYIADLLYPAYTINVSKNTNSNNIPFPSNFRSKDDLSSLDDWYTEAKSDTQYVNKLVKYINDGTICHDDNGNYYRLQLILEVQNGQVENWSANKVAVAPADVHTPPNYCEDDWYGMPLNGKLHEATLNSNPIR